MYIDNTRKLSDFYKRLVDSNPKFVVVDTEFISNHKYRNFPKLCLIQVGYNDTAAVIDVLSNGIDLSILQDLFLNRQIIKVFHDFKQDILALLSIFDYIPQPIMDTQMMAMLCDYQDTHISYSELSYSLLKVKLKKELKRTNWMLRPLSEEQIKYAFSDVTYLHSIYKILHERLEKLGRLNWITEDIKTITEKLAIPYSTKNERPNMIRQLLCEYKNNGKLLHEISDAQIYRLSYVKQYSKDQFNKIVSREYIDELRESISHSAEKKIYISSKSKPKIYLIQALIQQYSLKNNISYHSVSSTAEINRLINNNFENIRLLNGWRYNEIGREISKFLAGEIKLTFRVNVDDCDEIEVDYLASQRHHLS